jgi:hypothetical protein
MSEFDDSDALLDRLREKLLRAQLIAVGKLSRAARGRDVFGNDRELRACIALARLAPMLLGGRPRDEEPPTGIRDPLWWTAERQQLWEELNGRKFDMRIATTQCHVNFDPAEIPRLADDFIEEES